MPTRRPSRPLLDIYPHITDRDLRLIALLGEHQVLTTGQIHRLEFQAARTCQLRLAELRNLGLLERFRFARAGGGSDPWHWTLGLRGAQFRAAATGTTPPTPRAHQVRLLRVATSPTLQHLIATNELFVRLAAHARHTPGTRLDRWWSEYTSTARFLGIRPDGHGIWTHANTTAGFFVECDRGTENLNRVIGKLDSYHRLATSGGPHYPVLFWLTNPRRENNLHQLLSSEDTPIVTATTTDDRDPAGPAWLPGTGDRRVRIVDLPSDHGGDNARNPNWHDGQLDLR